MILFYSETITERIKYVVHFILKEQMGIDVEIRSDYSYCEESSLCIINYSSKVFTKGTFNILPHGLLKETTIIEQEINCINQHNYISFFQTENSDFSFDVFASVFYLISRYEEYLPHQKDEYGRYAHINSIAYKQGFLNQPIVNIWIDEFSKALQKHWPSLEIIKSSFHSIITHDIDMAWSYKHKGILRNIGGFLKKPNVNRLLVLLRVKKDPFDSYGFINEKIKNKRIKSLFFFLLARKVSNYDKNISPKNYAFKNLILNTSRKYTIGIHPSWQSNFKDKLMKHEKIKLEIITEQYITNSRQHYIKFSLPDTYQELIKAGILNEFSMGYGSINGFRASVASSFFWYDLSKEETTSLRVNPFCFMDANSHYEQRQSIEQSQQELVFYYDVIKKYNGLFIPIFHNNFLGTNKEFKGWKEIYTQLIDTIHQNQ